MASHHRTEMKVPTRPAPPVPTKQYQWKTTNSSTVNWDNSYYTSSNHSTRRIVNETQKKAPPPRPPPPKFTNNVRNDKKPVPSARPSQLITSLFNRKNTKTENNRIKTESTVVKHVPSDPSNSLLIDFSPPSSPTFTTRSSSDGLSVDSFGSDGQTPCSSSGNTSTVESGFEDDFDFFGGLSINKAENKDPWSGGVQDPFSPQLPKNPSPLVFPNQTTVNNRGSWVTFPSPSCSKKPVQSMSMPTIIRVKPDRPKPPSNKHLLTKQVTNITKQTSQVYNRFDEDDDSSPDSPPMPSGPPPALPSDVLNEIMGSNDNMEQGVTLYEYSSSHPQDLSFKENEVIFIIQQVNTNWYLGKNSNNEEGLVPTNFIKIISTNGLADSVSSNVVRAVYNFQPETWDDLQLNEGDLVNVLSQIDKDWLYGECKGKRGQFPASFVDRVPNGLPAGKPS